MASLVEVWEQVKSLLSQNISVIPVRDKNEFINNKNYTIKSPYSTWTEYQHQIITPEFLWHEMDKYKTSAIGTICGKISGNLEAIDIDVKHKPGIASLVFKDIQEMFPELFSRLRIHTTPSGGFHILYRIENQGPPGNQKLAGRAPTLEELVENPKCKPKYFLETRGEGGYVVAPPSLGYGYLNNNPIPVISINEREALINICKNYNEIIKEPKPYKPPTSKVDYFDENPFNHFSRTADPREVIESIGWKFVKDRGKFLWFRKPDGTEGNVHGSFNKETRVFQSFTPDAGLEEWRGYFLATLIIDFKFNGDKKKAHLYFTENGYGVVNKKIEEKQIILKANTGKSLPENFSEEAKKAYQEFKAHLDEIHPYGLFWDVQSEGDVSISREKLYYVCNELGFRTYNDNLFQIRGKFIHEVTERFFFDSVKKYIKVEDTELYEDICNCYEHFIEQHGRFTISRLTEIEEDLILKDSKRICYKFYRDKWVKITKFGYDVFDYDKFDKLVFFKSVMQRDLHIGDGGKYIDFLRKAAELDNNREYIQKIVGYYSHEYNDETMGYMVVLTEKCVDPKDGGRSGKNLWCKLFSCTTSICDKAGSQTKFDEKTFQTWNGEKIFIISDLPKDFDLSFFKNISTGGFVYKKLFKNEVSVSIRDSPKLLFSTNFSFNCSDGGLAARVISLEFTDFFKRHNGVDTHYKAFFPDDWNEEDWAGFDGFVIESIQTWLKADCKLVAKELSDTGWIKQFEYIHGPVIKEFIEESWEYWMKIGFISTDVFKNQYEGFCNELSIPIGRRPSSTKLNKAIEEYAKHHNVKFIKDAIEYEGAIAKKGRKFINYEDELPF